MMKIEDVQAKITDAPFCIRFVGLHEIQLHEIKTGEALFMPAVSVFK